MKRKSQQNNKRNLMQKIEIVLTGRAAKSSKRKRITRKHVDAIQADGTSDIQDKKLLKLLVALILMKFYGQPIGLVADVAGKKKDVQRLSIMDLFQMFMQKIQDLMNGPTGESRPTSRR
jgi:hypothetical protein